MLIRSDILVIELSHVECVWIDVRVLRIWRIFLSWRNSCFCVFTFIIFMLFVTLWFCCIILPMLCLTMEEWWMIKRKLISTILFQVKQSWECISHNFPPISKRQTQQTKKCGRSLRNPRIQQLFKYQSIPLLGFLLWFCFCCAEEEGRLSVLCCVLHLFSVLCRTFPLRCDSVKFTLLPSFFFVPLPKF